MFSHYLNSLLSSAAFLFLCNSSFLLLFHPVFTSICFGSYQILLSPHTNSLLAHSLDLLCWPPLAKCHTFPYKWSPPLWFQTDAHGFNAPHLHPHQTSSLQYTSYDIFDLHSGVMTLLSLWRESDLFWSILGLVSKGALNSPLYSLSRFMMARKCGKHISFCWPAVQRT